MTSPTATVSGIFFEMSGREDAPLVLFSHALGLDLSMWDAQVARLAGTYRILRYDLRGHGKSAQHSDPLTVQELATDVLKLLDHHRVQRVHFCGLSLGGMIGQWLGIHAQQRLLSLVLVNSAPRMGTPEQWKERIDDVEREGMSAISASTIGRWFTEEFHQREPGTVARYKSILEATSPAGYIACAKAVREASLAVHDWAQYGSIAVPTLIVTGAYDSAARPAVCQEMAAHIPASRYVELSAAHISPVEARKAFTEALREFLQDQNRPGPQF